jgi:hypothetical protein
VTDPTGQASTGQPRAQSAAHGPDDGNFETIRGRLDSAAFNSLRNTPYYADTLYPRCL